MADLSEVKVGQKIILTIGVLDNIEGDYFGIVSVINKEKTRIHLKDVTLCSTGQKFSGAKIFYLPEIFAVKIVSEWDVQNDSENIQTTESSVDEPIKFVLSDKEKEIIEGLIANHHIIETDGKDFAEALDDIVHYRFVGVNAVVEQGDQGQMSFIDCSTPHKIYRFKITANGSLSDRFKEWLESDESIKVVHGASTLAENLFHFYGINIKGMFDMKVVPIELVKEVDSSKVSQVDESISRAAILLKFYDRLTEHLLNNVYESFRTNLDYCREKNLIEVQKIYREGE